MVASFLEASYQDASVPSASALVPSASVVLLASYQGASDQAEPGPIASAVRDRAFDLAVLDWAAFAPVASDSAAFDSAASYWEASVQVVAFVPAAWDFVAPA